MTDGQQITFNGEADQAPGIETGDVVIIIKEKPHDLFKRKGRDLYYNQNLSLAEIAEEIGVTRQAVRHSIVKGENKLFRIRRKAWNYEKDTKTRKADTENIIRVIGYSNKVHRRTNC